MLSNCLHVLGSYSNMLIIHRVGCTVAWRCSCSQILLICKTLHIMQCFTNECMHIKLPSGLWITNRLIVLHHIMYSCMVTFCCMVTSCSNYRTWLKAIMLLMLDSWWELVILYNHGVCMCLFTQYVLFMVAYRHKLMNIFWRAPLFQKM